MCWQTGRERVLPEMPQFPGSTCSSQDPPCLPDPPRQVKAAGKRREAAPADVPPARALSPSLQVGGGAGILPGAEMQHLSVVSFLPKRKREQLVSDLNLCPCPSPKTPGREDGREGGMRGSANLSLIPDPTAPSPLAEDEKSSRKEVPLSFVCFGFVLFFSFKFSLRQRFGKASLHKAA